MQKKQLSAIIGAAMGLALAAPAAVWAQDTMSDPMAQDPASAPTDPMASDIQQGDVASFEELDRDGDGIISREEAQDNPDLMNAWSDVDSNADDQLDQAEFSAFEAESGGTPGAQPDAGSYGTDPGMGGDTGVTEEPSSPGLE